MSYGRLGAMLQGHPELRRTPGVDAPAGSLGMGLGLANGMALALKGKKSTSRSAVLAGTASFRRGPREAALVSRHDLGNLLLVIDRNGLRGEGAAGEIVPLNSLKQKMLSFGWSVEECDGHDFESLREGLGRLEALSGRPRCLLAKPASARGSPSRRRSLGRQDGP
ncbi:hypothetical protein MASR2M79_00190 [Aminivibrio sp.]